MLPLKSLAISAILILPLSCTAPNTVSKKEKTPVENERRDTVSTEKSFTGNIVRDCTGTYIRINQKDYQVCNADILKSRKVGEKVSVSYIIAKSCPEFDGTAVCMLYHPKEALIRIKKIL